MKKNIYEEMKEKGRKNSKKGDHKNKTSEWVREKNQSLIVVYEEISSSIKVGFWSTSTFCFGNIGNNVFFSFHCYVSKNVDMNIHKQWRWKICAIIEDIQNELVVRQWNIVYNICMGWITIFILKRWHHIDNQLKVVWAYFFKELFLILKNLKVKH